MSRAGIALRVALLPVVMVAGYFLYGLTMIVASLLMPMSESGPLVLAVQISHGFLAATLHAALISYPLARLFGRAALGAAALTALPVVAVALQGIGSSASDVLWLRGWDLVCYAALLFGGVWLARRRALGASVG